MDSCREIGHTGRTDLDKPHRQGERVGERNATLADVAKLAGVSTATVSRALSAPDLVSAELRGRIQEVIDQLGYVPNPAARALASAATNVIGVLIPSVTNNVFSDVLRGIYSVLRNSSMDVQLANTHYSPLQEEKLLRVFLSQRPAGLIVTGIDQSPAARKLLERARCPIVQIMEIDDDPVDMMVGFSHWAGARATATHLIEQGYRKIAFIGARMDPRTQRRLDGFADALKEAGIYEEQLIVTTPQPSTVGLGCVLFSELLSIAPDVDAVFCNNDDLALGVLFESQRRHIDVPNRLGICGFNDLEIMSVTNPPISSVRTFRHEMGAQAVQMLLDTIAGKRPSVTRVDIGFDLIKRRSSRRQ